MAKVKGVCKLCHKEDFLCDSHIISEYFYRELYDTTDGKHDALIVRAEPYVERSIRKGWYDQLLCEQCEKLRNQNYESHVIDLWQKHFPGIDHGNGFMIQPVDYTRTKLFFLSILWLAGVSGRLEFEHVNLGPHSDKIRLMLLNGDAGKDDEYKFYGVANMKPDNEPANFVMDPVPRRVNGNRAYLFYFGGCKWFFIVSSHRDVTIPCSLQRPRALVIAKASLEKDELIAHFMRAGNKYHGTAGYPARTIS